MEIIPVLDLLDGKVVHAKRGERHRYQPIHSSLSNSSEPDAIIEAYFTLFPFKNIYIADLNAIQGNSHHLNYLESLVDRYSECTFWIDAGLSIIKELKDIQQNNKIRLVIGTENNPSKQFIQSLHQHKTDWALSLDFLTADTEMDASVLETSRNWPKNIIAMMLYRVGTENGTDGNRLQQLTPYLNKHQIYAAGGIANETDLITLNSQGFHGALIATAIHNGALGEKQIQSVMNL